MRLTFLKCLGTWLTALAVGLFGGPLAAKHKPAFTGSVEGKVTFTGRPLPGGTVAFFVQDWGSFTAPIRPDGSYVLPGVPVGSALVAVETESAKREPALPPDTRQPPGGAGRAPRYLPIPKKFTNPNTSGLTCNVHQGRQVYALDLAD